MTADGYCLSLVVTFFFFLDAKVSENNQHNKCERRSIDDASSFIIEYRFLDIVDSMRCHFPLSNNNDDEELDTRSSKKHSKGLSFFLCLPISSSVYHARIFHTFSLLVHTSEEERDENSNQSKMKDRDIATRITGEHVGGFMIYTCLFSPPLPETPRIRTMKWKKMSSKFNTSGGRVSLYILIRPDYLDPWKKKKKMGWGCDPFVSFVRTTRGQNRTDYE